MGGLAYISIYICIYIYIHRQSTVDEQVRKLPLMLWLVSLRHRGCLWQGALRLRGLDRCRRVEISCCLSAVMADLVLQTCYSSLKLLHVGLFPDAGREAASVTTHLSSQPICVVSGFFWTPLHEQAALSIWPENCPSTYPTSKQCFAFLSMLGLQREERPAFCHCDPLRAQLLKQ